MITYFKFTHGAKAGRAVKAYLFPKFSSSYCCCVCRMRWSRGDVVGGRGAAAALGIKEKQVSRRSAHTHAHAHAHEYLAVCVCVCVALCNLIMGPAWTATPLCGGSDACGGGWQIAKNCTHILLFKSPTTNTL